MPKLPQVIPLQRKLRPALTNLRRRTYEQALPGSPGYQPYIAGVIPKSDTSSHQVSNADLFDFELTLDDMTTLSAATKPEAEGGDCDVTIKSA